MIHAYGYSGNKEVIALTATALTTEQQGSRVLIVLDDGHAIRTADLTLWQLNATDDDVELKL